MQLRIFIRDRARLSVHWSVNPFARPFIRLSVRLSVCLVKFQKLKNEVLESGKSFNDINNNDTMNPRGTCYNLGGTVNSVEQTRKERKRERNRERPKDGVSGVKKTVFWHFQHHQDYLE